MRKRVQAARTLQRDETDMRYEDGAKRGTRVLPDRCIGREVVEGGDAAVAFVSKDISSYAEAGANDCESGGK